MIPQEIADLADALMTLCQIPKEQAVKKAYQIREEMQKKGWKIEAYAQP